MYIHMYIYIYMEREREIIHIHTLFTQPLIKLLLRRGRTVQRKGTPQKLSPWKIFVEKGWRGYGPLDLYGIALILLSMNAYLWSDITILRNSPLAIC